MVLKPSLLRGSEQLPASFAPDILSRQYGELEPIDLREVGRGQSCLDYFQSQVVMSPYSVPRPQPNGLPSGTVQRLEVLTLQLTWPMVQVLYWKKFTENALGKEYEVA